MAMIASIRMDLSLQMIYVLTSSQQSHIIRPLVRVLQQQHHLRYVEGQVTARDQQAVEGRRGQNLLHVSNILTRRLGSS